VIDISRTGVRFEVVNADSMPDKFLLLFSKGDHGQHTICSVAPRHSGWRGILSRLTTLAELPRTQGGCAGHLSQQSPWQNQPTPPISASVLSLFADNKAGGLFLDGPRRLEAAGGYHGRF